MALGAVLGSFNGLIISYGKVPPIIATLGTLSIYRGLVFFYSQGTWINSFELPKSLQDALQGHAAGTAEHGHHCHRGCGGGVLTS